ncbi:MAG: EamA family transporter RarD [Phycisphaeraceae bacterium]|nr:MAG: EamA family transporter RarD [Phycisphaeraceae bacterium]
MAAGVVFGVLAYGSWGFVPFYFNAIRRVDPVEVLCHRVIWSVLLLAVLVHFRGRWREARDLLREPSTWRCLAVSTAMIATNWLVFIYAVTTDRLLEASLGYFINPLVSIVLGMVFLSERLRPRQWIAVGFAAAGVAVYTTVVGAPPWISLVLAFSFGTYGLVRKQAKAGAVLGLAFETALLAPLGLAYLVTMHLTGLRPVVFLSRGGVGSAGFDVLLMAAGPITAFPLLFFAAAARRLRLSTMGFMQYATPTLHFLIAVLAFGEAFDPSRAIAFALIWVGIGVFLFDSVHAQYKTRSIAIGAVFTE